MKWISIALVSIFSLAGVSASEKPREWSEELVHDQIEILASSGQVELEHFMVADGVSAERQEWLLKRLEAERQRKYAKQNRYEVVEINRDGDLAMAVVAVSRDGNPYFKECYAQAFCKDAGTWKPAPLAGQFALTGFGTYESAVVKAREALESWATASLSLYREKFAAEVQGKVVEELAFHRRDSSPLVSGEREEVLKYFMGRCRDRDLIGVLACLDAGAGNKKLRQTLLAVFVENQRGGNLWRSLINGDKLMAVLPAFNAKSDIVSLGVFDPSNEKHPQQIVEFRVQKKSKQWVVKLPYNMRMDSKGEFRPESFNLNSLHSENQKRLLDVRDLVLGSIPIVKSGDLDACVGGFMSALTKSDLLECVGVLSSEARLATTYRYWQNAVDGTNRRCSELFREVSESGDKACSLILVEKWPRVDRYAMQTIVSQKVDNGWHVVATDPAEAELKLVLNTNQMERLQDAKNASNEHFLNDVLKGAQRLDALDLRPASEHGSSAVEGYYRSYEEMLESGGIEANAEMLLVTDPERLPILSAIAADAIGRMKTQSSYRYEGSVRNGSMLAAIVSVDHGGKGDLEYVAYPMVSSNEGVSIVPQFIYLYEHGRGQVIHNRKTMEEIKALGHEGFEKQYKDLTKKLGEKIQQEYLQKN